MRDLGIVASDFNASRAFSLAALEHPGGALQLLAQPPRGDRVGRLGPGSLVGQRVQPRKRLRVQQARGSEGRFCASPPADLVAEFRVELCVDRSAERVADPELARLHRECGTSVTFVPCVTCVVRSRTGRAEQNRRDSFGRSEGLGPDAFRRSE